MPKIIPNNFSWTAPEFVLFEKGKGWFLGGAITAIILLVIAYFLKYWLFMGVIVAAIFALWSFTRNRPDQVRYNINHDGVKIGIRIILFPN